MLTKEVREWLKKVERGQYQYDDAIYEFMQFAKYLTREEMVDIKNKINKNVGQALPDKLR